MIMIITVDNYYEDNYWLLLLYPICYWALSLKSSLTCCDQTFMFLFWIRTYSVRGRNVCRHLSALWKRAAALPLTTPTQTESLANGRAQLYQNVLCRCISECVSLYVSVCIYTQDPPHWGTPLQTSKSWDECISSGFSHLSDGRCILE